ncbi:hypothetical protein LCGC14_1067560 [marine sediment metagenome]|uniref:Uncharacterized protein n=1 Tax=marine sediment metagenome TaxID=412755 RepID=A0A0F9Q2C4_9ZZZZ
MKYLLPIIAGLVLFAVIPAKASHIPLEMEQSYTDRVTICKKENLMGFIKDIKQVTHSSDDILDAHGCSIGSQTFVVKGYICSFVVEKNSRVFSVIKTDDSIHEYIISFINPSDNLIECTGERIDSFPMRIPSIE